MNIRVRINVQQFVVPIERVFHFHTQSGTTLPAADLASRVAKRDVEVVDANEFARYAPQAEFVWMERSGTFAHIEEPDAVFGLLRRFVT